MGIKKTIYKEIVSWSNTKFSILKLQNLNKKDCNFELGFFLFEFFSFVPSPKHGTKKKSQVLVRKQCILCPTFPTRRKDIFHYYKNCMAGINWEPKDKKGKKRVSSSKEQTLIIQYFPHWYWTLFTALIDIIHKYNCSLRYGNALKP